MNLDDEAGARDEALRQEGVERERERILTVVGALYTRRTVRRGDLHRENDWEVGYRDGCNETVDRIAAAIGETP